MVFAAVFGWSNNGSLGQPRSSFVTSFHLGPFNRFAIFRYDPCVRFLLDRCYGHFVRPEAKRYVAGSEMSVRAGVEVLYRK